MRRLFFLNKMHGAMVDDKLVQLMKVSYNKSYLLFVTKYIADIMDENTIKLYKFQNDVANSEFGASSIARCAL